MNLKLKQLQQKSYNNYSKWLCDQFTTPQLLTLLELSESTIRSLRRGHSELRKAEARLLQLTLDRRIMPDSWPLRFTFEPDDTLHLCRSNLSWGQLEHYSWVSAQWGETLRRVNALQLYLDDVVDMLTEVQRLKATTLRRLMIESVETGKPYDVSKKA